MDSRTDGLARLFSSLNRRADSDSARPKTCFPSLIARRDCIAHVALYNFWHNLTSYTSKTSVQGWGNKLLEIVLFRALRLASRRPTLREDVSLGHNFETLSSASRGKLIRELTRRAVGGSSGFCCWIWVAFIELRDRGWSWK